MVDAARRPLAATARGRRKALLADGDGRGQTERGAATAIGTRNWTAGRLSTVVVGLATGQSMRLQLCGEADASPEAAAQRHSSVFEKRRRLRQISTVPGRRLEWEQELWEEKLAICFIIQLHKYIASIKCRMKARTFEFGKRVFFVYSKRNINDK